MCMCPISSLRKAEMPWIVSRQVPLPPSASVPQLCSTAKVDSSGRHRGSPLCPYSAELSLDTRSQTQYGTSLKDVTNHHRKEACFLAAQYF